VSERIHLLLVEDNPGDARLIGEMLRGLSEFELVHVGDLAAALARLAAGGVDVVLLDLGLPDSQGLATVSRLVAHNPRVPVVVLTGNDDESVSLQVVKHGAQDYLVKGAVDAALLVRSLRYARERMRAAEELRASEERLRTLNRELQEATGQLIQTAKLTALGELAAGVAHELNQPLNGIALIVQALLKYLDDFDRDALRSELRDVLDQVASMKRIIDHMRLFVRQSTDYDFKELDVNVVMERALLLVEQQIKDHGAELERDFTHPLPLVRGDAARLEQVFLNLLMNARAALDDSGRPDKRLVIGTRVVHLTPAPETVVVEVRDNGVGIPAELKDKIFLPFFTTKDPGQGTGLGLSIARKIVEEHDGRLEAESTAEAGTTFRVLLPIRS
jgi:C4-dicarboxylate-specific signal transduction histidine kinase